MARKQKYEDQRKFYYVSTSSGLSASELILVSAKAEKHCDDCGASTGVMFKDAGPRWIIDKPIRIQPTTVVPGMECYNCLMTDPIIPFAKFEKGRLIQMDLTVIMLAHDIHEVVDLVSFWKNGLRPNLLVDTPSGEILVLANPKLIHEPDDYKVKCPHCRQTIVITVGT